MKKNSQIFALALIGSVLAGCTSTVPYHQLTRWEKSGDGFKAYHLRDYGTFAAGELASSDNSEMLFDGLYYLRASAGKASNCTSSEVLSSGWAVRFRADRIDALPENFGDADVARRLAELVPDMSMACAFRVTGNFAQLQFRNRSGQTFSRANVPGSLYGFRAPASNGGVTQEMWFISVEKDCGGRVSSFKLADGSMAVDLCYNNLTIHTGEKQASKQLRK